MFHFVRHGQATHNEDAKERGEIAYSDEKHRDAKLTDFGIAQCQKHAGQLHKYTYDVIYCSPLRRCRETLLHVYPGARFLPVKLDDRLMEPQGTHHCNRRAEKTDLAHILPTQWDLSGVSNENPYPKWDESYEDDVGVGKTTGFFQRIRNFTEDVMTRFPPNTHILVITHHDWVRGWTREYYGTPISLYHCEQLDVGVPTREKLECDEEQVRWRR
jgi:broad specificity phosphatase PhoE